MDARALNRRVRKAAAAALAGFSAGRRFRAVEVGGGAGGAFRRWMELLARFRRVEFTVVDRDRDLLHACRREALFWAGSAGSEAADGLRLEPGGRRIEVRFRQAAVSEAFRSDEKGTFDLLAAQSFWDLVPRGTALALARRLLAPGGVFYAALTFSGGTRFDPPHRADPRVLDCYHRSMEGARGGDSGAGEHLIEDFRDPASGFWELASGRSDWNVAPQERGYPADERFFLETILGFVEKELAGAPDVPPEDLTRWLDARHAELRAGRLRFTARQCDLAARANGPR